MAWATMQPQSYPNDTQATGYKCEGLEQCVGCITQLLVLCVEHPRGLLTGGLGEGGGRRRGWGRGGLQVKPWSCCAAWLGTVYLPDPLAWCGALINGFQWLPSNKHRAVVIVVKGYN